MSNAETVRKEMPAGKQHKFVAVVCFSLVAGMLGMSYAAVPLYRLFCQVTGYGGTTQVAIAPSTTVIDHRITMRFDANVSGKLGGWDFKAKQLTLDVKLGDNRMAYYVATNTTDKPLTGTAMFNVTPESAGVYFNKIECFCFAEQTLQPGETVEMPVSFYIDPEMLKDPDADHLKQLTLSYKFYPSEPTDPQEQAGVEKERSNEG